MEFGLSEIQLALQESLNRFLTDQCGLDRIRKLTDDHAPFAQELWQGLSDLGIPGTIIPEEFGGVGLGTLDAAVVSECMGKFAVPLPFLAACVIGPKAILLAGNDGQKSTHLGEIAKGASRIGLALSEVTGSRSGAGVQCSGEYLNGTALFVTDPDSDLFLVSDQSCHLFLVSRHAEGLEITSMPHVDRTRGLCRLQFDNTRGELLPGSSEDPNVAKQLIDLARIMLAADTLGAAQEMLDQAIAYAMQRKQFNRVIASFQAVKHMCAEMAAEIEPSRSLVWYAAHAFETIPNEARLTACHAKAHLAETGTFVARTATVVHGGMGFTDLLGLHYWFKRIGYNRQLFGGPELVREEAAKVQGLV